MEKKRETENLRGLRIKQSTFSLFQVMAKLKSEPVVPKPVGV